LVLVLQRFLRRKELKNGPLRGFLRYAQGKKARKRYSTEQIVAAVKQAELGLLVADLILQMGITEQTYYRWKKNYAGLESDQVRELKQLADEGARLKKLVAELGLDKAVLQDHQACH
jgi:putative transposase